jgi:hypothetical protein
MKSWQDWGLLVLGLWLLASPWVLGFASIADPAALAAWILGAAVVVLATAAVSTPRAWEEVVAVVLGITLIASPWVVGFDAPWLLSLDEREAVVTSSAASGVLVGALAVWSMLSDPELHKRWKGRRGPQGSR